MLRYLTLFAILFWAVSASAQADSASSPTSPETVQEVDFVFEPAPDDRVLGNATAPHTLIVYASNMCPHCGEWFTKEWPTIKADLVVTGELRFVFRPLPSEPAQLSMMGFMFAECAPAEDYMDVIEEQFGRQASILKTVYEKTGDLRAEYDAIAARAGLDTLEAKSECLTNPATQLPIQTSGQRADAAGISGIPSFIFDGQIMKGKHDTAAVKGWLVGRSSSRD